jgi:predicted nucleotidyltransferase
MGTNNSSILSRIRTLVEEIDPSADVILYGSRARGEENSDSDWDLLILVDSPSDLDYERIFRHKLYDIELELGEAFSVTVHNKNEWQSRYWMTPLFQNITREGIRI